MEDSSTRSPYNKVNSLIPIVVLSDDEEEMFALPATRSCFSPSHFQRNARSIESITHHSRRRLPFSLNRSRNVEIEDLGNLRTHMRIGLPESLIDWFRRNMSFSVTDFANSMWCEKQMEFKLLYSHQRITKEMKAGRARHLKLEQEVTRKLKVPTVAAEDVWAVKFMNFIISVNELLTKGLTREVPLVGLVNDVWVNGVIDEVRMPLRETNRRPSLVETKTHSRPTSPSAATKERGRFQLMFYKRLLDIVVAKDFPAAQFFDCFGLNPEHALSKEIQHTATSLGFSVKTLEDLVKHYASTCHKLPPASDQLLLRFEFQDDNSLLKEEYFTYDAELLMNQIANILEFWKGEREARYVSQEEYWKCRYCDFKSKCPSTGNNPSHYNGTSSSIEPDQIHQQQYITIIE